MADSQVSAVAVGDCLPGIVRGPVDRAMLALFAGASNDHVPLHIDIDFARAAGMDDVFAHGMLVMAWVAQLLTAWRPQAALREWKVRFTQITPLYATVRCDGVVTELVEVGGVPCARIAVTATTEKGTATIAGDALVALA